VVQSGLGVQRKYVSLVRRYVVLVLHVKQLKVLKLLVVLYVVFVGQRKLLRQQERLQVQGEQEVLPVVGRQLKVVAGWRQKELEAVLVLQRRKQNNYHLASQRCLDGNVWPKLNVVQLVLHHAVQEVGQR
jgi:hypothetical protein